MITTTTIILTAIVVTDEKKFNNNVEVKMNRLWHHGRFMKQRRVLNKNQNEIETDSVSNVDNNYDDKRNNNSNRGGSNSDNTHRLNGRKEFEPKLNDDPFKSFYKKEKRRNERG